LILLIKMSARMEREKAIEPTTIVGLHLISSDDSPPRHVTLVGHTAAGLPMTESLTLTGREVTSLDLDRLSPDGEAWRVEQVQVVDQTQPTGIMTVDLGETDEPR
jgi:hypothetical protein